MADGTRMQLFSSERHFKVWTYVADRRRLLIRSARDDDATTRIDVFFAGVSAMLLAPYYEGLTIRAGGEAEYGRVARLVGHVPAAGGLFMLEGGGLTGFVESEPPRWHEDEGWFRDPSHFGRLPGTT
jgi:hypothetical protein